MGFLDFLKTWFGTKNKPNKDNKKTEPIKENKDMKSKNSKLNNKGGFHPELLFLVNRPYAEYVDFEEIKTKK